MRATASTSKSIERRVVGGVGDVCKAVTHVRNQSFPKRFVFFVSSHDVPLRGVGNEPRSAPNLFLKLRWGPPAVSDEKPNFMGIEDALFEHALDLLKVAPHVNAIHHWDAFGDVCPRVQVVQVAIFDGASNADACVEFGQIIHHLIHVNVHKIVQHKPEAAFVIVFAEKHDFSSEIRVVEEGLAEQNVPRFGQGLIAGCETNHGPHEVRSVLGKIEAWQQSSVICIHERPEPFLDGSDDDGFHRLCSKRPKGEKNGN
jgi:hypothetical protein